MLFLHIGFRPATRACGRGPQRDQAAAGRRSRLRVNQMTLV
jgi:hypothetical protein